jgi:hypothetical protein
MAVKIIEIPRQPKPLPDRETAATVGRASDP